MRARTEAMAAIGAGRSGEALRMAAAAGLAAAAMLAAPELAYATTDTTFGDHRGAFTMRPRRDGAVSAWETPPVRKSTPDTGRPPASGRRRAKRGRESGPAVDSKPAAKKGSRRLATPTPRSGGRMEGLSRRE